MFCAAISGLLKVWPEIEAIEASHKDKIMYDLQKSTVLEIPKLRKSAEHAPHCFSCGAPNRGGNLVLCHSNDISVGRGIGFKTPDYLSAIMCMQCHDLVDGRAPSDLTKDGKREMHRRAHERTLRYWFESGLVCVA